MVQSPTKSAIAGSIDGDREVVNDIEGLLGSLQAERSTISRLVREIGNIYDDLHDLPEDATFETTVVDGALMISLEVAEFSDIKSLVSRVDWDSTSLDPAAPGWEVELVLDTGLPHVPLNKSFESDEQVGVEG